MRVLVTGATGFIGKRLCDLLIKEGHLVRVITRSSTDFHDSVLCDMENDDIPSEAIDDIEVIFHLAGYAHDLSNKSDNKEKYMSINVDVTMKLARLASLSKVRKFIYVSSVKAVNSHEIYGESKRQAEISLLELAVNTAMEVSVLRPSLVYGPNVKGNLQAMQSAIKGGWFPPIPKLSNCRSMIHVDDVARSLLFLALNDKTDGEIYIATDGKSYSSSDIYEEFCILLGKKIPKRRIPLLLLNFLALLSPSLKKKIKKITGNELYDSTKLEDIGFKTIFTLRNFNEKAF
ncbi:NAD-dependent epimerase/dehydratase family protein [SAR86 cluster bacterium]|nr:NAD-dependent epimerase/dehydratase family protein [SAR86 cluster bacterium]